jgi:hypothetical protein
LTEADEGDGSMRGSWTLNYSYDEEVQQMMEGKNKEEKTRKRHSDKRTTGCQAGKNEHIAWHGDHRNVRRSRQKAARAIRRARSHHERPKEALASSSLPSKALNVCVKAHATIPIDEDQRPPGMMGKVLT